MDRYVRWSKDGYLSSNGECFDIGGTVSGALGRYNGTGDPFAGSTDPYSAGNGSLMRLGPRSSVFRAEPGRGYPHERRKLPNDAWSANVR